MIYDTPEYPAFTDWIIKGGYLREPFRLIDVGVQGGIHPRWRWLGDQLELWAFDALKDAIETLVAENTCPGRLHYFHMGLGNDDGVRLFQRHETQPMGSAFLPPVFQPSTVTRTSSGDLPPQWSEVPIRRLDTLMREGLFSRVDAIKLDCEGFEIEILKGAEELIADGAFAIESETNMKLHPWYEHCHFIDLYSRLAKHRFEVYDLYYYRSSRPEIPGGYPHKGQPDTFDFLFLRGFGLAEDLSTISPDRLIKMMIVAELYSLQDVASNLLMRSNLSDRIDVQRGMDLLRKSSATHAK